MDADSESEISKPVNAKSCSGKGAGGRKICTYPAPPQHPLSATETQDTRARWT